MGEVMGDNLHYVKIKRDKIGQCNICGKESTLSWDHVPPKGSIISSDVEIITIANSFNEIENPPREMSQNGMKFRTICPECNNLIGSKYDVVFNDFIKRLIISIKNEFEKTKFIEIGVNIEVLVKSIFAHMLAAKGEIENTVPDSKMKEFLLEDKDFEYFNIHYWFYPYYVNQVIRDILVAKINVHDNALVSVLKLYPIAFLVTDSNLFLGDIPRLNDYYDDISDNSIVIKFDLSKFYDFRWPIIVDNNTLIAGGQSLNSSVFAIPRNRGNI